MNFTKGSLINKDWFLLWMGLLEFIFSLGFYTNVDALNFRIKTNTFNSKATSKMSENFPGIFSLFNKRFKNNWNK